MADQIDNTQPEKRKITAEHIFKNSPPKETTERKIKFATGCDYYGLVMRTGDNFPFFEPTCGQSDCVGCNTFLETMNKAFKEEVEKWQFKLFDDGRK